MTLQGLKRSRAIERVYETLREAILDGDFIPGARLKQAGLASDLGVSQSLIREALARLAEEGLVDIVPYRGTYVHVLTVTDAREICELRGALEWLAAGLAVPHLAEGNHLEVLSALVSEIEEAARDGDEHKAVDANLEFHRHLVALGGNARLRKAWTSLLDQLEYMLRRVLAMSLDDQAATHREWLMLLRAGDTNALQEFVKGRMERTCAALVQNWASVNSRVADTNGG